MSMTDFPHGVTSMGVTTLGGGGIPVTSGTYFFVDYGTGNDGNAGTSMDKPFKTLTKAYDSMTTNKYDVCVLMGSSAHAQTAMLTISKNRCIFIGLDGASRTYGQGQRITLGVTTDTADIAIIKNTGVRNAFYNIKFDSSNTLTQSVYAFAEGGEYTYFQNCEFYKSTHLTTNLAAELLCNGDSSQWVNCTFGDLVNTRGTGGSCVRPNILLTRETITGKVARDCTFTDCTFLVKAADTGVACMYSTLATDIERRLVVKRPIFMNAKLGTANPGEAILCGAAQTEGWILIIEPNTLDISAHASASVGAYVTGGSAPVDSTTGIAGIIDT